MNAVRLAFSWLTVLPVRGPAAVDRVVAGRAIAFAPLVGVALGLGATALMRVFVAAGTSFVLAGLLVVGALALVTRGMHLDGLADTADGLGCYGPPERAREIMKSGGVGPFAVAALVFAIGVQAFSYAALAECGRWWAIALAVAVGRVAVVPACRGAAAAPGAGFGALVADTQGRATAAAWPVIAASAGLFVVPGRWWLGAVAVGAALVVAKLVVRHCVRRFEGISGDVLGAAVEIAVAVTAAVLSLRC
ncbi:adenosylcobinamide-GDP ribazoletransferase [Nocardia sp. CDC159]|uniref:Adenosylcobinamide-GDP ribazoletransferase n=1 Tax=Nocardia pulmonis TaxID=2951408 RepID=A0A9X2E4D6_9NOCA|nr:MULTISPECIES: adenosylcobinamide-GDP ribazoletransferase [Nocardia]MCM6773406.1 adenosylcobinamide-GDP ribazoletransferase [Nocardia pulmonis]MCM6786293.1 adenosylcobinamide-GDP ribazoletransferase [Nocardia sp. CDC159]